MTVVSQQAIWGTLGNKAANGSATVLGGGGGGGCGGGGRAGRARGGGRVGGGGDVGSMVHLAIWHGTVPRTGYH